MLPNPPRPSSSLRWPCNTPSAPTTASQHQLSSVVPGETRRGSPPPISGKGKKKSPGRTHPLGPREDQRPSKPFTGGPSRARAGAFLPSILPNPGSQEENPCPHTPQDWHPSRALIRSRNDVQETLTSRRQAPRPVFKGRGGVVWGSHPLETPTTAITRSCPMQALPCPFEGLGSWERMGLRAEAGETE